MAQLAVVNPVNGLHSGVVTTIVSSQSMGMILMMDKLASAIVPAVIDTGDYLPITQFGWTFTLVYFINGIVILLALFDRTRTVRGRRLAGSA